MTHKMLSGLALGCFFVLGWLSSAHAVVFEVKAGNSTCIKADISANFTITYPITNRTNTVVVPLPGSAVVGNGSSCGGEKASPDLQVSFGNGHSLGFVFVSDGKTYRVTNLSLSYNLNDNDTFPQSISNKTITLSTNTSDISAQINTTYRCLSSSSLQLTLGVNITFFDFHLQAYMSNANLSTNETVCSADISPTTAAPTTTPVSPTTPVPPTHPERGNYTIQNANGTACLLARMGLQLNVTYFSKLHNKTVAVRNLHPNETSVSGSCDSTKATLLLTGALANLSFTFILNSTTNKYYLGALNMSANWQDMTAPFRVSNSSLQYMQGTLGRSYMCNVEEVLRVDSNFSINTYEVQMQPFGVHDNQFGPADECRLDKGSMLIPIIVGACLAGLVLIVLIAYLIGRKRSHAGYQTI